MFDMINIFEVFLPQLLRYPNPTDPLNGEAAALLMRDSGAYESRVKGKVFSWSSDVLSCTFSTFIPTRMLSLDYVIKYATKDAADEAGDVSESEDEMSSVGEYDSGEEEPAGAMEV